MKPNGIKKCSYISASSSLRFVSAANAVPIASAASPVSGLRIDILEENINEIFCLKDIHVKTTKAWFWNFDLLGKK